MPPSQPFTTIREALSGRTSRLVSAYRSGPLSVPAFRLLAAGQFISTAGDYCYTVALPWLILCERSSAAALGIALACYGVPRALLTLPGGSLADRFGPRLVMLTSDAVRCALTAVFTVLAASHVSSLMAVGPVAAVLGAWGSRSPDEKSNGYTPDLRLGGNHRWEVDHFRYVLPGLFRRGGGWLECRRRCSPGSSTSSCGRSRRSAGMSCSCLLYTSDAADDLLCVDLGGRRIIK